MNGYIRGKNRLNGKNGLNTKNTEYESDPMSNIVFTVPKKQCTEIEIQGIKFIQVDMGMDADTFLLNYLKWQASGDSIGAVAKKDVDE